MQATSPINRPLSNERTFFGVCTEKLMELVKKIREIFITILQKINCCAFGRVNPINPQAVMQVAPPVALQVPIPVPPQNFARPQVPPAANPVERPAAPQPPRVNHVEPPAAPQPAEVNRVEPPVVPQPPVLDHIEPPVVLQPAEVNPVEPPVAPQPRVLKFLRAGELHDFTARKIAGLSIDHDTHFRDGKPYQYITLNTFKVLLWGKPNEDIRYNHFALPREEDRILVKDSVEQPGKIEISHYNSYFDRIDDVLIVDPTKLYLRRYVNYEQRVDMQKEHVYVTNETNMTEPHYLTLVEQIGIR